MDRWAATSQEPRSAVGTGPEHLLTRKGYPVDRLDLAADGGGGFWPTGVIMIIVVIAISGSVWMWRERKLKKDK
ncbi:conserved hypothetical protein [Streptomyces sviceus ATCC 29083]|uniref:Uncharacterized protein n=1 Tax=Streptomyces sviceus (strain ATCC 29083 / DSM 924 / JCM 4929 / NBRC 13980 / NCIMB 11184 / NRRL 5439 / UC 5370) TaxID=463191 RepID=B5HUI6_STRX2|nr:conserved hypothetical protein [Streptomyces sviceus ATCC 29083]